MWHKEQDPKKVMNKILVSIITLFYLAYSKILRDLFQMFDCSQVNGHIKQRLLRGALNIQCDIMKDGEYRFYVLSLALPVLVFFIMPLPLLAIQKLRNVDRASDAVYKVYGFLYDGYKTEFWFWEVVVLMRKILLAGISVFYAVSVSTVTTATVNADQYQQGLLASLVMGVSLFFQMLFHPYEGEAMNNVEVMGLTVGFLSLYLGLWTFHSSAVASVLVAVLIFGLNIIWAVYVFVALYKEYKVAKFIVSVWNSVACCSRCKKSGYEESKEGEAGGGDAGDGNGDDANAKKSGGDSWWKVWGTHYKKEGRAEGNEREDIELAPRQKEVVNPLSAITQ